MIQYVNKNSVEKILEELWQTDNGQKSENRIFYNKALQDVQTKLDTIDVKEVDIEKEFDKCCENYIFDDEGEVYTARHFFELGLRTKENN